jgi:hypothetical protein
VADDSMNSVGAGYDLERYRKLLAEATDETKRLALIRLLIDEKARDQLAQEVLRARLSELGLSNNAKTDLPDASAGEPKAR